ncbi:unnamed protein product (macronuclear) [Paramecium tetraurelia]|uniref:Phosphatidylinositol 3-kinase n=1 Tax=Paramecium tetraurelia TaxID=5888 RepID=A0EIN5_PARTE|nr:uncharacterized protein GSPATT00027505001 [Paramecium tetraurelia]CAK95176.1 unnamed protein product [Paramecium tetraurelia]|eukprot:XP_001462549.1 hypothetical protein (macronuclear) [Paramecium tetraurelia strain d4-2]
MQQVEEKWLICADPDSCQIYTLNINTNEVRVEQDVDQDYRQKALQAIQQIESILKLKTGMMSEFQIGRYLAHGFKADRSISQKKDTLLLAAQIIFLDSNIFVSINSQSGICQIKLNQYRELFQSMPDEVQLMEKPNIVEISASLVTGADEVIKSVLREVYQRFNVKLRPKDDNNQFILQISGFKEFLTGNHPMLSYDRVRVQLRGMKHLEVILTEIPKQFNQTFLFPPIIYRIKGGEPHPQIDWIKFRDVPALLWYSPIPLKKYESEIPNTQLSLGCGPSPQIKFDKIKVQNSQDVFINHEDTIKRMSFDENPTRAPSKENTNTNVQKQKSSGQIYDLISMKNELQKLNMLKIEQNLLYSGECDWPFSVKICSIENLLQTLEQDNKYENQLQRATYNGLIPPLYITKKYAGTKVEEEQHKQGNKKNDESDINKRQQVHLKLHKRTGRVLENKNIDIKRYIPFGGQDNLDELATLQERYDLDFLPYLISVQVSLFHGCKLLTPWCQAETKNQPFSQCPKFYQTVTFQGIKISQLPLEARLCFNIIAHSATGQQQIIGCTTMYIFYEETKFRSSVNQLNIWPFYKIDPRLLCMGQYWGWVKQQNQQIGIPLHSNKNQHFISSQLINRSYGRLLVQLDQFNQTMKWSLRDEKQMEELGFSKSARSQRYQEMRNKFIPNSDYSNYQQSQSSALNQDQFISTYQNTNKNSAYQQFNTNSQSNSFSNSQIFLKKQRTQMASLYNIHHRQQANPYEQYMQVGYSTQDQGTTLRFGEMQDRQTNFAQSMMHMNQGSSFNVHDQSSTQVSTFKLNHRFSKQSIQQNQSTQENYNQVFPQKNWSTTPRTEDLAILQGLLKYNPLNRPYYTDQHKYILMICRNHYKTLPYALQIFLMAIEWDDPEQVREAHNMIKLWTPLPPEDALPLLDAHFADETVRLYAVERVSILSDDELQLYMLELTQCLMFEKHLFNPLAEMLLERSLQNPWVVGHELFWLLKAQLHVRSSYERYSLLLEQLLMLCGEFRQQLMNEVLVDNELFKIAQKIKEQNVPKDLRQHFLKTELLQLYPKLPKPFSFALDSRMEVSSIYYDKCKVMDSKKMSLWLAVMPKFLENDDELQLQLPIDIQQQEENPFRNFSVVRPQDENLYSNNKQQQDKLEQKYYEIEKEEICKQHLLKIIFKTGDDIRQDMLTLQLIKIMDKIWLDDGLDFRMKPYKAISTQDNVGMIQVVSSSETIEKIHSQLGLMGAFELKTIWNYLKKKNFDTKSFETATDNFLRSCAGYCVATYILGIGDRHSGNIMITETGHLFHIDFAHFFGNFKQKFGIKRERSKFVLTEEMAFVIGGRDGDLFKKFQQDCTNAYNLVRKHGHFIINIFLMNLSAGMPELQQASNVKYIEDQLALNLSDQEATAKFKQEIVNSLNDTWRQVDNWYHYMRRK